MMGTKPSSRLDDESPRGRSLGFSRHDRLRTPAEFERVYRGRFAADEVLVVHACRHGTGVSRLGVSVSRRIGGAVERNRWKRRLREAFRVQRPMLPAGLDLVVRPRKGARLDYHAIAASLVRLARRLDRTLPGA